jgi:hypothetical protein
MPYTAAGPESEKTQGIPWKNVGEKAHVSVLEEG